MEEDAEGKEIKIAEEDDEEEEEEEAKEEEGKEDEEKDEEDVGDEGGGEGAGISDSILCLPSLLSSLVHCLSYS